MAVQQITSRLTRTQIEIIVTPPELFEPLDVSRQEIRLLYIKRCEEDPKSSSTSLDMEHVIISLREPEDYNAISYECSAVVELSRSFNITLNGRVIHVKPNIQSFFEHVLVPRHGTFDFLYWNDALCINSTNSIERAQQVGLMSDIFHCARYVDVWLGPATADSEQAFQFINSYAVAVNAGSKSLKQRLAWVGERWHDESYSDKWKALGSLLTCSYWTRRWTVQESILNEAVLLHCGRSLTMLFYFSDLLASLTDRHQKQEKLSVEVQDRGMLLSGKTRLVNSRFDIWLVLLKSRKNDTQGRKDDLLKLLVMVSNTDCYDLRDKIFSLTGLHRALGNAPLTVDYAATVEQVYIATAKKLVLDMGNLNLLFYYKERPSPESLPSWVPNFGLQRYSERVFGDFNPEHAQFAISEMPCQVSFTNSDSLLHCPGQILAEITEVQELPDLLRQDLTFDTFKKTLANAIEFTLPTRPVRYLYPEQVATFAAHTFRIMFLGETQAFSQDLRQVGPRQLNPVGLIGRLCEAKAEVNPALWARMYLRWARHAGLGRDVDIVSNLFLELARRHVFNGSKAFLKMQPMTDHEAVFGVCISHAQNGDYLATLRGCALPVILRRASGGGYHVLGPACFEGMDGAHWMKRIPQESITLC